MTIELKELLMDIKRENHEQHEKLFDEISRINATQGIISQKTDENYKTLHGNGKMGLKAQQVYDTNEVKVLIKENWYKTLFGFVLIGAGGTGSGVMFFRMLQSIFSVAR